MAKELKILNGLVKIVVKSGKNAGKDYVIDQTGNAFGFKGTAGTGTSKKGFITDVIGHGMNKSFQAALQQKGVPEAVMQKGISASLKFLAKNGVYQDAILVPKPRFDLVKFIKETGYGAGIPNAFESEEDEEAVAALDPDNEDAWWG